MENITSWAVYIIVSGIFEL